MAKLIIAQRNRAVGMLQTGMSSGAVARALNLCHSTILRLWTLIQQTGDVSDRPKTGHPRVLTPAQDRLVFYVFLI